MTTETRTTIEPLDIKAVEIECEKCHYRTTKSVDNWLQDSQCCDNCGESWRVHIQTLNNVRDAVSLLRIISLQMKEKMPFSVRLEIAHKAEKP
jgi:hypothetical protein